MSNYKPLVALAATALAVTVGYAVAQGAASSPNETQTVIVPGSTTGVVPSMPPGTYKAAPGSVEPQSVMSTGVNSGSTRINVGDHATPRLPGAQPVTAPAPVVVAPTVMPAAPVEAAAPPAAEPAPMRIEAAPEPAPMPAPKPDRN
jgi:hypothetical protein